MNGWVVGVIRVWGLIWDIFSSDIFLSFGSTSPQQAPRCEVAQLLLDYNHSKLPPKECSWVILWPLWQTVTIACLYCSQPGHVLYFSEYGKPSPPHPLPWWTFVWLRGLSPSQDSADYLWTPLFSSNENSPGWKIPGPGGNVIPTSCHSPTPAEAEIYSNIVFWVPRYPWSLLAHPIYWLVHQRYPQASLPEYHDLKAYFSNRGPPLYLHTICMTVPLTCSQAGSGQQWSNTSRKPSLLLSFHLPPWHKAFVGKRDAGLCPCIDY